VNIDRITRDVALGRIRHHIADCPPSTQDLPLFEAQGLVCAQDISAAHASPDTPRSAVDGYAIASAATRDASPEHPARFTTAGLIRPSTAIPDAIGPGMAAPILTGGQLPPGADCVIPNEEVAFSGKTVAINREASVAEHVRPPGADINSGTRIVRHGEELTPAILAALAVSGATKVTVFKGPRVLVLALGNELSPLEAPAEPGRLHADNLLLAGGLLRARGVADLRAEVCTNEVDAIADKLHQADARCIVTTGGTGPGARDFILGAALKAGFTPLYTGLALTPGKSSFAALRGDTLLFALPGTPWAVFTLMHAMVLPAMCWLRGRTLPVPSPILARPQSLPHSAPLGWERLVPCTNTALGAELLAHPLVDRTRESRLDMLQAQGLLIVSDKAEQDELLPMIPIWENLRGLRLG
jgi:molybdopterin molybdotransferase